MRVRIPAILRDIQQKNPDFSSKIHSALEHLYNEILGDRPLLPLQLPAVDASAWSRALADREQESWLNTDWFFAETYFYRNVLQCTRFWETGRDPFRINKSEELSEESPWRAVERALSYQSRPILERLPILGRASLWGNRIDLSYTAAVELGLNYHEEDLLVDHTEEAFLSLYSAPGEVHVLLDNTGTELLLDLVLVDTLLEIAPRVQLHVKMVPTFVSDATAADVRTTITALEASERTADLRALGARLRDAFQEERLGIHPGLYWNSHRFFFDMPPLLRQCLASARLVISKGDANFRRITGDAIWNPSASFQRVASFFPAPVLALRTLKSDSIVGLSESLIARLDEEDPSWRNNGRRGIAMYSFSTAGVK